MAVNIMSNISSAFLKPLIWESKAFPMKSINRFLINLGEYTRGCQSTFLSILFGIEQNYKRNIKIKGIYMNNLLV